MTAARDSGDHTALTTGDELARMPDHELSELIDGRIVPMSPTNPEHGRIEAKIAALLYPVVSTQHLGLVMTGEVGIFTKSNPDRVRGADVVFISHAQYDCRSRTRGFLDVAPELIVEILSPETPFVDTQQKVHEYLTIGVRLVLVVDPLGRTVAAHRPTGVVQLYPMGESVSCDDAVPGFRLPVAALFDV